MSGNLHGTTPKSSPPHSHCGHDPAQFVTADEGTSYCPACEAKASPGSPRHRVVYVGKLGHQIEARYVRLITLPRGREIALTWIPRPACAACGGTRRVKRRGWTDEGVPMLTCADCGGPDE